MTHRPDSMQKDVDWTASVKYSEAQYNDLLSVCEIRANTAAEMRISTHA